LLKSSISIAGGSPTRTTAFLTGKISVQDEASQLVPVLLDAQPGDRVLDLCAAPGGKTPPLARAVGAGGLVLATDRHEHRLRAMKAQFERIRSNEIHIVALDATIPLPFLHPFQRMLVDAPCSGTGTLARHPEIRWRLSLEKIQELHRLQTQMLAGALACLASGGRLVYSTCSLEPEENEQVVAEVLERIPSIRQVSPDVAARNLAPHLAPGVHPENFFGRDGYFRTLPGEQPTDGFFAAVLEKT
jgi:16S rRNA (cytosine967-C5)-methyltransferase